MVRLSQIAIIDNSVVYLNSQGGPGEQMFFEVPKETLAKSPAWRSDQASPPLPPRKALAAAEGVFSRMGLAPSEWRMASIGLEPTSMQDIWIYVITYVTTYETAPMNSRYKLRILVLMDGQPIIPRITSLNDPSKEIRQVSPNDNKPSAPRPGTKAERDK